MSGIEPLPGPQKITKIRISTINSSTLLFSFSFKLNPDKDNISLHQKITTKMRVKFK